MSQRIGELARHTGIYGVGTIAGGLARAALVPIIARYVPTDEYGKASIVFIFVSLLAIVSELGLSSSMIRYINEASQDKERREVVSTILLASLLLAAPIIIVCILFADRISLVLLGSSRWSGLVLIGLIGGFGNAFLQIALSFERALARSTRYVMFTIVKGALALGLSIVLVVVLRKGAIGLVAGNALPAALLGIFLYWHLLTKFAVKFVRRIFFAALDFGGPLVPMNLAMWVLSYSDIYLLRRLVSSGKALSEVGLYQYAHEICLVLVLPITALNLAWPQFIFANYRRQDAKEMFAKVEVYFALAMVEVAVLLAVFADYIIAFVGSRHYAASATVIPWLAGSLVFYGLSILFASGLYLTGKTKKLGTVVASCAGLNVLLNIVLIPPLGKTGAAIATLITDVVLAFVVVTLASKEFPIPFRLGRTFAAIGGGTVIVVVSRLSCGSMDKFDVLVRAALAGTLTLFLPRLLGTAWHEVVSLWRTLKPSGQGG